MSSSRKWLVAQAVLAVVLLAAVGRHFWKLLDDHSLQALSFGDRGWYLLPAGFLYLAAHTIWGTYWWELLRYQGVRVSWFAAVRAYFVSQYGKYIPGKVWVILLRVWLLRHAPGANKRVIGLTGMYETLVNMAAGAILAAVLLPYTNIGGEYTRGRVPFLIAAAALPLGLFLLVRLTNRIARRRRGPDAQAVANTPLWLLLAGVLQTSVGWCLLAVSLRLTTTALWPAVPVDFSSDLVSVTASYVIGFVFFFLPGGLGAREGILQACFESRLAGVADNPAGAAVLIALLLRIVWTAFEVVIAGGLYLTSKLRRVSPADGRPRAFAQPEKS